MKKTNLMATLIFVLSSPVLLAQDEMSTTEIINKMKEIHQESYEANLGMYDYYEKRFQEIEAGKEREQKKERGLSDELEKLKLSEKNYNESLKALKLYAKDSMEKLPFFQSVTSRKKSFYDCLLDNMEKKNHPYINECQKKHPAKFSTEEKMMIKNYSLFLSLPKNEIHVEIAKIEKELETFTAERKASIDANYNNMKGLRDSSKNRLIALQNNIDEIDRLKQQESFFTCGPSMKEIDLENEYIYEGADKKGPFYGVPRDNQDGLGTCFANTAKNLLVGLSGGEMVASFLDIALQYKKVNNTYVSQGLDAGGACSSLLSIQKVGFCDQKYAPLETGEKNEFLEGLIGKEHANLFTQGQIISQVSRFLMAKESLEKVDAKFSDYFLKNPKEIIKKLKENPDLVFPLPIVNITPAQNWQTKQAFYVSNKNPSKEELAEYTKDMNELDKKLQPKMIQMALNNESYEKIIEAYSKPFKELLEKYGMSDSYDQIIKYHKNDFIREYNEENRRKLFKTVRFLQNITNSDSLPTQSFVATCINAFEKGFDFLEKLNPLVKEIEAINASSNTLLDGEKFRDGAELMQLTTTPACLNDSNRTPIDFGIECSNSVGKMKEMKVAFGFEGKNLLKAYRMRVVDNLLRGFPVGRELSTVGADQSNHVHTIVGVRYNPNLDRCEYKIRESQNGRSDWHSEKHIVEKTIGFVEVRRL